MNPLLALLITQARAREGGAYLFFQIYKGAAAPLLAFAMQTGAVARSLPSPMQKGAAFPPRSPPSAHFLPKTLAILRTVYYNNKKCDIRRCVMNKIKTIARPAAKKVTGCGECRSTCQSACKTSCTVGNQSCERISRENDPEKNN